MAAPGLAIITLTRAGELAPRHAADLTGFSEKAVSGHG